jgi:hypothetical protein
MQPLLRNQYRGDTRNDKQHLGKYAARVIATMQIGN